MITNKLVIGTAQFGMPYGINKKEVNLREIDNILKFAKKNKINHLDTAPVYKNSLKKLSMFSLKDWKIISKISSKPNNIDNVKNWVHKNFFNSLNILKINKIDTILIHNEKDIFNKKYGDELFKSLNELKSNGLVKNIGCSIYTPKKIVKILERYEFDIIQSPYNIFDQRILSSGLSKLLFKKKIKLHLRSIFLQGLLLENKNFPKKFRHNKLLKKFNTWLKKSNYENIPACLGATSKVRFDKLIVGVDNLNQLKEIIKNLKYPVKNVPSFNVNENSKIIDPRKW